MEVQDFATLLAAAGYMIEQFRRAGEASPRDASDGAAGPKKQIGDDFLLTTAIAFNQGVLANIDAVDTALIGIFAAASAFAIFAVDKINELADTLKWLAVVLLAASALLSVVGYAFGFVLSEPRDVPRPLRFVADVGLYGTSALARAIRETVRRSEENLKVREVKRIFALASLGVLIAGVVVVTYARLAGHTVVQWP